MEGWGDGPAATDMFKFTAMVHSGLSTALHRRYPFIMPPHGTPECYWTEPAVVGGDRDGDGDGDWSVCGWSGVGPPGSPLHPCCGTAIGSGAAGAAPIVGWQ